MGFTQDPEAWVAAGGDRTRLGALSRAGRVAALSDGDARVLAGVHPDLPHVGTLGDWVGGADALEAGLSWLRAAGATHVEGPALLAPWFPQGASLGPFEIPPFPGEPTERADRWLSAGFSVKARWAAVSSSHDVPVSAAMDRVASLASKGWTLQGFEPSPSSQLTSDAFERGVDTVVGLATAAFSEEPGFRRVGRDAVAEFYRPLASVVDPRLSLLARDPQGAPRAFLLGLPGPVQGKNRAFQVLTIGVHPTARAVGVATWLLAAAHQAARRAGYTSGVHLVRGETRLRNAGWGTGEVMREYALLQRAI